MNDERFDQMIRMIGRATTRNATSSALQRDSPAQASSLPAGLGSLSPRRTPRGRDARH